MATTFSVASEMYIGAPFQRSEEVWLEDGNVVLVAEGVAFKVYRGILARSSPVFSQMFTFPQPPVEPETMEGSPVVHMSDSAAHLRYFLVAMYDPRYVVDNRHTDRI